MTTTAVPARALSPTAAPTGGSARLAVAQVLGEFRQLIRVPEFAIGVVGVPIILYSMFGLPNAGQKIGTGTDVAVMLLGSFAAYGVVSQAIFTFGVDAANDRGKGWLRRLRATPMPIWAYFGGRVVSALAFTVLIWAGQTLVAVFGAGVSIPAGDLLRLLGVMMLGTVAFSPFGFAIAYWFRPKAAAAVGNLIFLPLSFCSGFFQPLNSLPDVFQTIAPYLPTYHYGYLVWGQLAPTSDIEHFTGGTAGSVWVNVAWVAGAFVVFLALTVVGYRRDLDRERN